MTDKIWDTVVFLFKKGKRTTLIFGFGVIASLFGLTLDSHAQEIDWKVNADYLFDNNANNGSIYSKSKTYNAIMLRPIVGIKWADRHSLYGGIHLKKIPGTNEVIDKAELTIYYNYQSENSQFRAGAFPRADVLPQYWTQFYSTSYRTYNFPLMHGIFYQYGKKNKSYINAWLDWTNQASATQRESYLYGFSGQFRKSIFYADFISYMNHLGRITDKSVAPLPDVDYGLMQATTGVMLSNSDKAFSSQFGVGVLAGIEREKGEEGRSYSPIGFVAIANAEYMGLGIKNYVYTGNPRMVMYDDYGSQLYLGSSFFRGNLYYRNDLYVNLLQSNMVKVQFNSIQHVSEGKVFFQQSFSVKVNLEKANANKVRSDKYSFPWKRIFE